MMLFTLLAIVAAASAHDQAWEDYKLEFNKHYTAEEETMRYATWKKDVAEVELHNAMYGNEYTQAVNEFSDLTDEEYDRIYLSGLRVPEGPSNATMYVPTNDPIPNAVDWRTAGMVTPVKNQGQCGSCYSFSATGAHEGAWKKKTGTLPSLSEQELVDCSGRYGNYGCRGGWYQSCWKYNMAGHAEESERDYPYTARQGRCKFSGSRAFASVSSFHDTQPGSENDLTNALARVGPVSVAIDAGQSSFRRYRSGVHYAPGCSSRRLSHAVLAVGYGSEGGQDYYLVKNSWGTRWGAGGYIKMARNRGNNCGIATKPSYPIV
jgi:cathepsin L